MSPDHSLSPPNVELPGTGSFPPQVLAALLEDQRQHWQRGDRPLVETYLQRHPALRNDREAVLDLIYHEICLRQQRREGPQLAEYQQRFPELAGELALQFEVHHALQLVNDEVDYEEDIEEETTPAVARPGMPVILGYEVLEELHCGDVTIVYKARQVVVDRLVTIKMPKEEFRQDSIVGKQLVAEGLMVAGLDHPHIVKVCSVSEFRGLRFLVREYLDGPSLADILRRGPVPIGWAARTLAVVAAAVHYVHTRGIVHGNLEPANILLDRSGRPVVAGFGKAELIGEALASMVQGTAESTPADLEAQPQFHSRLAFLVRQETYSLGAMLYALLVDRPRSDAGWVPLRQLRPDVPVGLEQACLKCLSKGPDDRYASALALAEALSAFATSGPTPDLTPCRKPQVHLVARTTGERIMLAKPATVIGRDAQCDLVLSRPAVSRRHCQILVDDGQVSVEDLNSRSGTRVNGLPVKLASLRDGDWLELGGEAFQVRLGTPNE